MSTTVAQITTPAPLVLSFTGLCLFHPDPTTGTVHVYLPTSPAIGCDHHEPRVYVLRDNAASGCGVDYLWGARLPSHVDLTFLKALASPSPGSTQFPLDIANLSPFATLDQSAIDPDSPTARCCAHIELPPGEWRDFGSGPWCFNGEGRASLPFCVSWTLHYLWLPLPLPIAKNAHRLVIVNVPTDELPGHSHAKKTVHYGEDADHFDMFYALTSAGATHVIPKWNAGDKDLPAGPSYPCSDLLPGVRHTFGSFIRCMVAQI